MCPSCCRKAENHLWGCGRRGAALVLMRITIFLSPRNGLVNEMFTLNQGLF